MAKIEIDREVLHKSLLVLGAGIPSNPISPADGVYKIDIIAKAGTCWITIANAKCEISTYAKCEADEDTSFCLPHGVFDNTIRNFPEGEVKIETVINEKTGRISAISIKPAGKRKKYKIACEGHPDKFPHWPKIDGEKNLEKFTYKMGAFSEMVRALAQNVDAGDPTGYYRDINFVSKDGKLKMISGNAQIAASIDTDIPFESNVIVLKEVAGYSAQLEEGDCTVRITGGRIYIKNASTRLKAKMVDAKPAGFLKIFATEPENGIRADRDDMLQSLKRMSVFTDENNKTSIECKGDVLVMKASNKKGHSAEEEIEISNPHNMKFSVIMNYAFLQRSISIIKSEKIIIKRAGDAAVTFIRPDDASNKQIWMLAHYSS